MWKFVNFQIEWKKNEQSNCMWKFPNAAFQLKVLFASSIFFIAAVYVYIFDLKLKKKNCGDSNKHTHLKRPRVRHIAWKCWKIAIKFIRSDDNDNETTVQLVRSVWGVRIARAILICDMCVLGDILSGYDNFPHRKNEEDGLSDGIKGHWFELNWIFFFICMCVCVGREIVVNLPIEIHPRQFGSINIYIYPYPTNVVWINRLHTYFSFHKSTL